VERRAAGVLLHPTSLPGPFAIGDLGEETDRFLDWLVAAGQSYWQVLPLGPTGLGNSPYNATSAFAGNPLLISPERLESEGLLPEGSASGWESTNAERVDYASALRFKEVLLRRSWDHVQGKTRLPIHSEMTAFVEAPEQECWLEDWALYSALKRRFGGEAWNEWPAELRRRDPQPLAAVRREMEPELAFQRYVQFLFFHQWFGLKERANGQGVRILGDVPFYVALDSAEVWAHPDLFRLDEQGRPLKIAGVPPDYFSATGQLWGNPIYRWDVLAQEDYAWWIDRLLANLRQVDLLRIDHFRGFAGYWVVDAGEETAVEGSWTTGPGLDFFEALQQKLEALPLVAEDLGFITPDVRRLRQELGLPGMRVLQFGFGSLDNEHLPHRVDRDIVYYTGTHDNDTFAGWFADLAEPERGRLLDYLGSTGSEIHWDAVRAVLTSRAELAMIPLQDILGLGRQQRMNTPAVGTGNWEWRLAPGQLQTSHAARLRRLTEVSGRLPASPCGPDASP
jgi:4-alpha-glucanotransferase